LEKKDHGRVVFDFELQSPDLSLAAVEAGEVERVVSNIIPPVLYGVFDALLVLNGILGPREPTRLAGEVVEMKLNVRNDAIKLELVDRIMCDSCRKRRGNGAVSRFSQLRWRLRHLYVKSFISEAQRAPLDR
jgi:hypothetical protein